MSHDIDRQYYEKCAERERRKADLATDPAIKASHAGLAQMYEQKVARMRKVVKLSPSISDEERYDSQKGLEQHKQEK